MHARPIAVALLLAFTPAAFVTFASPRTARAQGADDETTKAARARFQEGVDFYDKGQFEKARAAFLQAYALRKHPAVLLNLAHSCLKAGHHLEAVKYFQQFLRESASLSPSQRSDAEKGLADARQKLGRFEISAPSASEIAVDGNVVGVAPLADPVDVEPGSHTIRAKMSDGTTDTKNVGATAGEKVKVLFEAKSAPPAAVVAPVPVPASSGASNPSSSGAAPAPAATDSSGAHTAPSDASGAANGNAAAGADTGTSSKKSILSRPKTMVPVYIGGVLVVAGVVDAIVFAAAKQKALDNGKKVANAIQAEGGGPDASKKTACDKLGDPSGTYARFKSACGALQDDINAANTNNTLANVGVGVAIGGAVLAVGWYLLAPKADDADATRPPDVGVGPMFGPDGDGLAFKTRF